MGAQGAEGLEGALGPTGPAGREGSTGAQGQQGSPGIGLDRSGSAITVLDQWDGGWANTSVTIGADGLGLISYDNHAARNLDVAYCHDVACTAATTATIDSGGAQDIGYGNSITVGADGLGLISYSDFEQALKVAHCSNLACSEATVSTLDSTTSASTSVAVGADGLALIAYGNEIDLKVAHCSNVLCTSATTVTVDPGGGGADNSVTIGSDGLALISYRSADGLKVAHCESVTCSSATITTLDGDESDGFFTSVTTGSDGLGLISYMKLFGGDSLEIAHCQNVVCTAADQATLDTLGDVGAFGTSITIGTDGLAQISYQDYTNGATLKVAHCSNLLCSSATKAVVDFAIAGAFNSITTGTDGFPLITYLSHNAVLQVAHCSNVFCLPNVRRR